MHAKWGLVYIPSHWNVLPGVSSNLEP